MKIPNSFYKHETLLTLARKELRELRAEKRAAWAARDIDIEIEHIKQTRILKCSFI